MADQFKPEPSSPELAPVTIIIVNWNSGDWLKRCLDALANQTRPAARILVIDNASSDGSEAACNGLDHVELIQSGSNLGFAKGNNLGIGRVETPLVALLNPDAITHPEWLDQLCRAAEQFPDCAAFGSLQVSRENSSILDGIGDAYHASGLVWRKGHGAARNMADLSAREIFSPCAAAALYRTVALRAVGGFDDDYFCYVEDVDLGFRLRLAGHGSRFVPQAIVDHAGSASTGVRSAFSVYYGHRNLVWTFVKNMPGALFWLFLPVHLTLALAELLVGLRRGQGKIIFRAKRDALRDLGRVWRQRKAIQAQRKASLRDIWRVLDKRLRHAR